MALYYFIYNIQMDLTKEYLYCYSRLYHPQQSKQANRRLLEIEQSQEAWTLAQHLIEHIDQDNAIHGLQLLSQKLNRPPPKEISISAIISFVYSKQKKTSIHWVCLAKAVLHMNPTEPLSSTELERTDMVKLVKEIPSAISQIRTNPPLDAMQLKKKYLSAMMPILLDSFDSNTSQILQIISIFLQEGVRLNNSDLMKKILSKQIQVTGPIIHDILQKESFQNLQQEIIEYIDRNRTGSNLTSIIMAFYRNINLKNITVQRFTYEIQYILAYLLAQQHRKENYLLCNSYEFWQQIFTKIQENELEPQKINVILSAICSLWNIICTSCKLEQLPDKLKFIKSSLSLDVDQLNEDEQINATSLEINNKINKFRDYGEDFLNMCLKYVKNDAEILNFIFNYVEQLTKGTLLQLQLSIFIIINVLQTNHALISYTKDSVKRIFMRKEEYNEYLCSRVINFIGKIQRFIDIDHNILQQGLSFLLTCINYEGLSNTASQNCCELLQSLNEQDNLANLQIFINSLYNILFAQAEIKEKVCENLTKSIIIYIYKYKKDIGTYTQYLQYYSSEIASFNQTKRKKYLQALIISQYWLNTKDQNKYLMPFSIFLDKQIPFLIFLVQNVKDKQQLGEAIYMINISIKSKAILVIQKWLQMIDLIFSKYVNHTPMHIIFTPLKNLINSALYLQNGDIMQKVFTFTLKWIQPMTSILLNQQKYDFTLTSIIIQIHLIIVKAYKQIQSIASLHQIALFSIKHMVNFLITYIHSTEIFQFQVFKFSLQYYMIALELGINPEPIVSNILCNYKKLADTLWKYIEAILFYTYKKYGPNYILSGLKDAKSTLDSSNPLTSVLIQALQNNEGKSVKNLLLSLC